MTLRKLVARLLFGQENAKTIAELRKAAYVSEGPRYQRTYEKNAEALAGGRATGTVKSLAEWTARHGHRRSA